MNECSDCHNFPTQCGEGDMCVPAKPAVGFTATAKWSAKYPYGNYPAQEADGIGVSTVSQEDANAKALANAKERANKKMALLCLPIGAGQLFNQ